ncbi:MAG: helix-turn-helix domain-containing protein [Clostridiaceae bacterium]
MNTKRFNEFFPILFEAISKGGFEEITKAAHAFLHHPIVLINVEYDVLVQIPKVPIGDKVWDTLLNSGLVPTQMVFDFERDNYVTTNWDNTHAFLVDWGMVSSTPRIMSSVRVDDEIVGYLGVIYGNTVCTQEDLDLADLLVKAYAIEFRRLKAFPTEASPLRSVFLSELFHGKITSIAELVEWKSHAKLNLANGYRVVTLQSNREILKPALLQYVYKQVERRLPKIYSIVFEDKISLLLTNLQRVTESEENILKQMDSIHSSLRDLNLEYGISDRFENLLEIKTYLYQAKEALHLASSKKDPFTFSIYRQCVLDDILGKIKSGMEPYNYIHPALPKLNAIDQEAGTEYYLTLETYMKNMLNSGKSSAILNIHRNTLLYRINKIIDYTGIDFENLDTCMHLHLSFYLV